METKKLTECVNTYLKDVKEGRAKDPDVRVYLQLGLAKGLDYISVFTYGTDNEVLKFLYFLKEEYIEQLITRIESQIEQDEKTDSEVTQ